MGELVMFQTHWRLAFENPPRRLMGWFERAAGFSDPPEGLAKVIYLPVIGIEALKTSHRIGGYPRKQELVENALKKVDDAVARIGVRQGPVIFEPLPVKLRRKKPPPGGCAVKLNFPLKPLAILRAPRKLLAHIPRKELSVSIMPGVPTVWRW